MTITDIGRLFSFIGGLGLFLFGMHLMSEGLQKSSGDKLKQMLGMLTSNRILAVLMGTFVTAIIQSSSATTVVVVGFVNAGIMNLSQAVGVIMGANIGTTVTGWLVSMGEWSKTLNPNFFAPLLVGIGAFFIIFSKSEKKKDIGQIIIGFGILFVGLSFMSGSITPYKDAPIFAKIFKSFGKNPLLGILAGAVITGIIQSSSASVGILQTLAASGVVSWNSAVYITLGQNIGTCVTALLSSAGTNRTAKRAAVIHLLFNVIGATVFSIIMIIIFTYNPAFANSQINSVGISIFHTIFNITMTILLFPFANTLVKLSGIFVRENEHDVITDEDKDFIHLDARILETPSFAMKAIVREVIHMADISMDCLELSQKALLDNDKVSTETVFKKAKKISEFEKILAEYLVKINNLPLNEKQNLQVKNLLYTISDLDRIGKHCDNIAELAEEMITQKIHFSDEGAKDIVGIFEMVKKTLRFAIKARETESIENVNKVISYEDSVDNLEKELRDKHISRLSDGACKAESGVIFLDAISNLERISDHAYNIARYVENEL